MQKFSWQQLFLGLVLVAVGGVILLNQTGMTDFGVGDLFRTFWPVFLIVFGLQGLLVQRSGGFVWNLIIIALGVAFLGRNLGWIDISIGELFKYFVPIAIILLGIGMIFGGGRTRSRDQSDYGWNPVTPPMPDYTDIPSGPPPAPPMTDDPNAPFSDASPTQDRPDAKSAHRSQPEPFANPFKEPTTGRKHSCKRHKSGYHHTYDNGWQHDKNTTQHHQFIGDFHIGQDYWELRPMNISHFIGDSTIDLTRAQIPLGETRINVSCFIGDVKVFVPNDPALGVQVVSSSLIGDVRVWDQERGGLFNHVSLETPGYPDTDKRVVISVSAFIGDVHVTKVG
jgi:lia operon protein LiaF